ncbi:hypothetical protein J437_LFUL016201 [Ladona fulva]|uniref:Uncharacterized protein n=1 Tax=Ladona fulva TaxID=123851 RepID=A0A8K0P9V9_LADFU|nr:hypothetical protein J437_LFUL016201 [Ladona fulva]
MHVVLLEQIVTNGQQNFKIQKFEAQTWGKPTCIVSTNCDPQKTVLESRKTGKGNQQVIVSCPEPIVMYTKDIGGVNRADQSRNYYDF